MFTKTLSEDAQKSLAVLGKNILPDNTYLAGGSALANNLYSILTSLSYFVDAKNSEMPVMLEKVDWKEIEIFFEKEAVRLGKKYLNEHIR